VDPKKTPAGTMPMKSPESLRRFTTDGIAEWLDRLVASLPNLAPLRTDPTAIDPAAAGWLYRFVRDVVTTNPVNRQDLSNIQIFLIEGSLDCVDWDELALDPRFRRFDWAHARLTLP